MGDVICNQCGSKQYGKLNKKNHTCRKCGQKFVRALEPQERVKYEHNGLWFFE